MDCSLSGSSVHGIFQARVLEWIAIAFSRGSSRPRNRTRVSRIAGRCFTVWATKWSEVSQSCPTLCDPMDIRLCHPCDFLGKSTRVGCHFLLQGTSQPRDRTQVSHIVDRCFTIWATRPQVNSREGTQLHPSIENWIKNLLSMALPIRTRPSFPLSQSLPSGSFHKPVILLHQQAERVKTAITEN